MEYKHAAQWNIKFNHNLNSISIFNCEAAGEWLKSSKELDS